MHRLSRAVAPILFLLSGPLFAQHPHGDNFALDCNACHNPSGWTVDWETASFDHGGTSFGLEGAHAVISCDDCHNALSFEPISSDCASCHTDVHAMTVGNDCARCHDSESWLVADVSAMHEMNGFVLEGGHAKAACIDCHTSGNALAWERLGTSCVDCHMADYAATSDPSHAEMGFGTDCASCHDGFAYDWSSDFFHTFFPLTGGHMGPSCVDCHLNEPYEAASPECISCHLDDFNAASSPNHVASGFPQDCTVCHTTDPGWNATSFEAHDANYFPIYSGEHQGEWDTCTDCHTTPGDYSQFSCIDCHEHNDAADLADEHDDVNNYSFNSQACYGCHPTGDE